MTKAADEIKGTGLQFLGDRVHHGGEVTVEGMLGWSSIRKQREMTRGGTRQ